jgi:hypothetical protein
LTGTSYQLPDLKPGQRLDLEVADQFNGEAVITVVRPNGYVVSQMAFIDLYKDK